MINHKKLAGAVFDFADWLTKLNYAYMVGRGYETARMVDLLEKWSKDRGLNIDRPNISGWNSDDAELREQYPSLQEAYEKLTEAEEEYNLIKKLVQDHDK